MKRALFLFWFLSFSLSVSSFAEYANILSEANQKPDQHAAFVTNEAVTLLKRNDHCEKMTSFLYGVSTSPDRSLLALFDAPCFNGKGRDLLKKGERDSKLFANAGTCTVKGLVQYYVPLIHENRHLQKILGLYCFSGWAHLPKLEISRLKEDARGFPIRETKEYLQEVDEFQSFYGEQILEEWGAKYAN